MEMEEQVIVLEKVPISAKVRLVNKPGIIAVVEIEFGDVITKGWRLVRSQYENTRGQKLWLRPPQDLNSHRFFVFIEDKELYKKIEDKVYELVDKISDGDYQDYAGENLNREMKEVADEIFK